MTLKKLDSFNELVGAVINNVSIADSLIKLETSNGTYILCDIEFILKDSGDSIIITNGNIMNINEGSTKLDNLVGIKIEDIDITLSEKYDIYNCTSTTDVKSISKKNIIKSKVLNYVLRINTFIVVDLTFKLLDTLDSEYNITLYKQYENQREPFAVTWERLKNTQDQQENINIDDLI